MPDVWKKKLNKPQTIFLIVLLTLVLLNILNVIVHYIHMGEGAELGHDFIWLWKSCRSIWLGYDDVDLINKGIGYVDGLGSPPISSALVPWEKILGYLLFPGFLPREWAVLYGYISCLGLGLVAWLLVVRELKGLGWIRDKGETQGLWLMFLSIFYWVDVIFVLNSGGIISFLLIIAAMLEDKNEYLAGLCLALAAIKPHIALAFYIVFFLKKRYKLIISSILEILLSWVVYLLMFDGNMINQAIAFLINETSDELDPGILWYGCFDMLRRIGVSSLLVTILGTVTGAIGIIIVYLSLKHIGQENNKIALYGSVAFISLVWNYKSVQDCMILVLTEAMLYGILCYEKWNWKSVLFCLQFLFFYNTKFFCGLVRRLTGWDWRLCQNLDVYVWIIEFVFMFMWYIKLLKNKMTYQVE